MDSSIGRSRNSTRILIRKEVIQGMDTTTIIISGGLSSIVSLLITIGYIKGRMDSLEKRIQSMQEQINLLFDKMINGKR